MSEFMKVLLLRFRVRYVADGAVIGSRTFVDEVFREARERFGPKRKDGVRKLRGAARAAAGLIWSARGICGRILRAR